MEGGEIIKKSHHLICGWEIRKLNIDWKGRWGYLTTVVKNDNFNEQNTLSESNELVNELNELVVTNEPVWEFVTYELVWDVRLSTSVCILEVNVLNELVVVYELVWAVKLSTSVCILEVKELNELVVTKEPVWLFVIYEPVCNVRLSTSVCIELVKAFNAEISVPNPAACADLETSVSKSIMLEVSNILLPVMDCWNIIESPTVIGELPCK